MGLMKGIAYLTIGAGLFYGGIKFEDYKQSNSDFFIESKMGNHFYVDNQNDLRLSTEDIYKMYRLQKISLGVLGQAQQDNQILLDHLGEHVIEMDKTVDDFRRRKLARERSMEELEGIVDSIKETVGDNNAGL